MSGSPSTVASATSEVPSPRRKPRMRARRSSTSPASSMSISLAVRCQSRRRGEKYATSSVESVERRRAPSMRTVPVKSLYSAHESPASEK